MASGGIFFWTTTLIKTVNKLHNIYNPDAGDGVKTPCHNETQFITTICAPLPIAFLHRSRLFVRRYHPEIIPLSLFLPYVEIDSLLRLRTFLFSSISVLKCQYLHLSKRNCCLYAIVDFPVLGATKISNRLCKSQAVDDWKLTNIQHIFQFKSGSGSTS